MSVSSCALLTESLGAYCREEHISCPTCSDMRGSTVSRGSGEGRFRGGLGVFSSKASRRLLCFVFSNRDLVKSAQARLLHIGHQRNHC